MHIAEGKMRIPRVMISDRLEQRTVLNAALYVLCPPLLNGTESTVPTQLDPHCLALILAFGGARSREAAECDTELRRLSLPQVKFVEGISIL